MDAGALSVAEREITSLRLAAAKSRPIGGHFDLQHLQKLHAFVFGDIYDWAGKLRHVNISKGNQFCLCMNLETYAENLFGKLAQEHYFIDTSASVPHRLAYYLSEVNVLYRVSRRCCWVQSRLFPGLCRGNVGCKCRVICL